MTLEQFGRYMEIIVDAFDHEFTVFGFKITFLGILIITTIVSIIFDTLGGIIDGD